MMTEWIAPKNKAILVVDDEKNIRFTVVHALKSEQFEVDAASSGVEGLQKFQSRSYDLLLVDLRMPGMTGIEMLREIRRESPELPPAVVITAYGLASQLFEAASLGAIDCVKKPFSIQTIRSLVNDIFDRLDLPAERDGSTPMEWLRYGKRELMLGHCREAVPFLLKAIELDPTLSEGYSLLGLCSLLDKKQDRSIEHFRRALLLDPANKTAAEYLAWLQ